MTSKKLKALLPFIPSDDLALTDLINRTCIAQLTREEAITKRDDLLRDAAASIEAKYKYGSLIHECETTLAANKELLEAWSVHNIARFGKAKSFKFAGVTMGWRSNGWSTVLIAAKSNWKRSVQILQELAFAGRKEAKEKEPNPEVVDAGLIASNFLRVTVEPAKDVMLSNRENPGALKVLSTAGVGFEEKENFFAKPDRDGQEGPEL
jgi:hypothetical protein